jgi:Flp pilus assembly protein TadG
MGRSWRVLDGGDRGRRGGQSLAELAVAIPVIFFLLMGGFDASMMISDKVTAGSAVRQGARLAAELGGSQTNPTATTASVDLQIVRNVLAVAGAITSATITEIDIYGPTEANGVYTPGDDQVDQYLISPGEA